METNIFRYLDHLNTFFLHVFQLMMTQWMYEKEIEIKWLSFYLFLCLICFHLDVLTFHTKVWVGKE